MVRRPFVALICACVAPWAATLGGPVVAQPKEMRCVYSVREETVKPAGANATEVVDSASRSGSKSGVEAYTLTLGLANDYLTEQRDNSPEMLVLHFPTRRIFKIDTKAKTYRETSLHGHVAFRVNELISRLAIGASRRASKKSGVAWQPPPGISAEMADRALDQFRAESLFALRLPKGSQWTESPPATAVKEGKGWELIYDREPIVKFTPGDRPLPETIRRGLLHFLAHRCRIHPTIRDRIMETGALPETLTYRSCDLPGEKSVAMTLVSATPTPDAETWKGIPADYAVQFDRNNPLDRVLEKLADRLARRPKVDHAALEMLVDNALKKGHALDAYLAWYEHTSRTGEDELDLAERIKKTNSPQLDTLISQEAPDPETFEHKLRALDAIDRASLTHGYILDVHSGALLTLLNRPADANQRFLKALDANPLLTSVYVLLGTNHFRAMETETAWRCFDAARQVTPASPSLADVNALEARFERDFPETF